MALKFSLQLPTDRVEQLGEFGTAEAIAEIASATECTAATTEKWISEVGLARGAC